jgi:ubiquinone/menaquinone biosynthesis C-methylase UbiE
MHSEYDLRSAAEDCPQLPEEGFNDPVLAKVRAAGWIFPEPIWKCLSDYEKNFAQIEFTGQRTLANYRKRLACLGFRDMNRVLDAACGMGQWSLALAELNGQVEGVDINVGRLLIASSLAKSMKKGNCHFRHSSIENLPYPPNWFDGIFCYGAFMFADMPITLAQFSRVLRPGGRLYLNANSYGWYLHLLFDEGFKKKNLSIVKATLFMIIRTVMGKKGNVVVREGWLRRQMDQANLQIVAMAPEGGVCLDENVVDRPQALYPPKYYGILSMIEVIAQKCSA